MMVESRFSRAYRTAEAVPQLDLIDGIGQRSASFEFELVNAVTDKLIRVLTPISDSPPTLSHDTTRTIKRQLSNFNLGKADTAVISPVTDRLRVYMNVGGVRYPLGRFAFTDFGRSVYTSGRLSNAILMDEMWVVDQQIERGFSADIITIDQLASWVTTPVTFSQTYVLTAITELLQDLPITFEVAPSPFFTVGSWTAGTNRGSIIETLAIDGDYFSPWFANDGVMKFIRSFDPADAVPTFDFDSGNKVMQDGINEDDDILIAPNRYIVISNSSMTTDPGALPIFGRYDVPNSAPYSIKNRGFIIPSVAHIQIATALQAQAVAKNLGLRATVFERTVLNTAIDPRHDSYDVIRWNGQNWLELAWSYTLQEGSVMRHMMRKTYS